MIEQIEQERESTMSKPGFYFYTGDWQKKTRILTLQTKGAWIDLMCALNESKPRGSATWTIEQYARFWSVGPEIAANVILELETTGVANVAPSLIDKGFPSQNLLNSFHVTVMSRRMVDEENAKENDKMRQQKRRSHGAVTPDVTEKSGVSSQREIEIGLNLKERLLSIGLSLDSWESFVEFRKRIKKPMTPHAMDLSLKTLVKLKIDGNNPREVIEQSIMCGYQGLFAVKKDWPRSGGRPPQHRAPGGLVV
jgi:hypothetical protein